MYVKGLMRSNVSVEITKDELFRCLCKELGFELVFYPDYNIIWIEKNGELCEQHDISYHGSPQYEDTGNVRRDIELYNALKCIKDRLLVKGE